METNITEIFSRLLFALPYIAVWITAIVICMQYQKHNAKETTILIIAFGILIVHTLVANLMQSWLISNYEGMNLSLSTMFSIMHGIGIAINLIAWALILIGIYQLLQQIHASKETKL